MSSSSYREVVTVSPFEAISLMLSFGMLIAVVVHKKQ
ncbi:putative holin-like toxin [Halobacillus amylolyticus]